MKGVVYLFDDKEKDLVTCWLISVVLGKGRFVITRVSTGRISVQEIKSELV
jgi:hypothetical protein